MKVLAFLGLLVSFASSAQAWDKVMSCDGDMLVVDRQTNGGHFEYQIVFRGALLASMKAQNLISDSDLNGQGELVRAADFSASSIGGGADANGAIFPSRLGYSLTNSRSRNGNYAVDFIANRSSEVGNYVFNGCWVNQN